MKRGSFLPLAVAAGTLAVGPSLASADIEIGGVAGAHLFSDDSELGTTDGPAAPSQRNGGLFGARFGAFYLGVVGLEGELGVIPTVARDTEFSVLNVTYRAHLVTQLRARDPKNHLIPFLYVGV